jgi:steroid delta-isomerase-like uncharacterized protein
MNEALIEVAARDEGVLSALTHLKNGKIEDAVAGFAEEFCFNDQALGLEFTNKERLRDFLRKERELYPNSSFQVKKTLVAEDHVVAEWLLEYTIREPFYGNVLSDAPVSVRGVSIVQTRKGKITGWSDYYDGLISRRTALTSYFTDWIEY